MPPPESDREGRLKALVEHHVDFVARVLRGAGTPQAEVDDDLQRTLIVAARRLADVRPGSEKRFLFRVAQHTAAHARRTLARRREVAQEEAPELVDDSSCPEHLTERRRAFKVLERVLEQMDVGARTIFVLYELNNFSTAQIAEILDIPPGTVASRLRRARADFRSKAQQSVQEAEPSVRRSEAGYGRVGTR